MIRIMTALATCLLLLSSCLKQEFENNIPEPTVLGDFLYETTSNKYLSLHFRNEQDEKIADVYFEVYSQNPFVNEGLSFSSIQNSGKLLFKGNADQNGSITLGLNVPDYLDTLFLCPRYIGLRQIYPVEIPDISSEITVTPTDGPIKSFSWLESQQAASFTYLGGYSNQGYPDYLEPNGDILTNDFLADINATLPENSSLPQSHPQYLVNGLEANLVLDETCEVWVTFVHEGAGWRNALGYYTYPLDNPPQSVDEIEKRIIIFPNVSYGGSGGALQSGNKVRLKFFEPGSTEPNDTFPAGYAIGWLLVGNGWNGQQVDEGNYTHYSHQSLNIETDPDLQKHNVLLYDPDRDLILLGFEDIRRDYSSCDNDFNDAVFYATANPITAINTDNLQIIDDPLDDDGDGVSNIFDEYPDDPERAYNNYYPSSSDYGTFAFEDLWPFRGDYDFNDIVIDYQFKTVTNAGNQVVELMPVFVLRAIGGSFRNGFGFSLDIDPASVSQVEGQALFNNQIFLQSNGTEAAQTRAVVIVFDDAYKLMQVPSGGTYVNTRNGDPYVEPDTIRMKISFNDPLSQDQIGLPPYNPFIIVNNNRSVEIHLPGYPPTDLVDFSLFGTGHDQSDIANEKYYFSYFNYPWAANLPESFTYPAEKINITNAHLKFSAWSQSAGDNYPDWFRNLSGYRNNANLYQSNVK
ncbi:MAG: LruC domain-containing protein [Bacteroidales bacterium]|nr:LruC domain-containing protein [Bacteroidales bacterium]